MFRHITQPLLRSTILLTATLTIISALQVFDIIQVMTDGDPNGQTSALVIDIYDYARCPSSSPGIQTSST